MTSNERYWSSLSLFVLWKREKQKQLFILFLFFPQLFEQDIFPSFLLFFQPHFSTVLALPLFTFSTILLFGFLKGKKNLRINWISSSASLNICNNSNSNINSSNMLFQQQKEKGVFRSKPESNLPGFFLIGTMVK